MTTETSTPATDAALFPQPRASRGRSLGLAAIADDACQLKRFWSVVHLTVVHELRVRYQRSMMGFLWTLLNPILMMTILTVVFSQLMNQDWKIYATFLFAGMIPWTLLAATLNDCAVCVIQNEGLIRRIYLPKLIFPLTKVLINLTTFLLSLVALFALLVPLGARFTAPMLLLPVVIVLYTVFVAGLGLVIATTNTFYRDCGHLINVVLQAWYFATPIVYSADKLNSSPWLVRLNPAYPFIRMFQCIIHEGQWPGPVMFATAAGIAAASLVIGYTVFKTFESKLVFRL